MYLELLAVGFQFGRLNLGWRVSASGLHLASQKGVDAPMETIILTIRLAVALARLMREFAALLRVCLSCKKKAVSLVLMTAQPSILAGSPQD